MSGTGQKVYCGSSGGWGWVLKATLVFIFGPNLKTKTLLRPRPKLNKMEVMGIFRSYGNFIKEIFQMIVIYYYSYIVLDKTIILAWYFTNIFCDTANFKIFSQIRRVW